MDNKIFSENFSKLLECFDITAFQLSKKIDVSYHTICSWEKGIKTPNMNNLLKICDFFNINADDLFIKNNNFHIEYNYSLYEQVKNTYNNVSKNYQRPFLLALSAYTNILKKGV